MRWSYDQLVGCTPLIGCYDQLIGCTPLIGRTLVGKNQLGRFEGSTTNKLVVQDNWSYVGQRTIVGCKFDAKMPTNSTVNYFRAVSWAFWQPLVWIPVQFKRGLLLLTPERQESRTVVLVFECNLLVFCAILCVVVWVFCTSLWHSIVPYIYVPLDCLHVSPPARQEVDDLCNSCGMQDRCWQMFIGLGLNVNHVHVVIFQKFHVEPYFCLFWRFPSFRPPDHR